METPSRSIWQGLDAESRIRYLVYCFMLLCFSLLIAVPAAGQSTHFQFTMESSEKEPHLSSYISLKQLELLPGASSPTTSESEEIAGTHRRISGAKTDIILALTYVLVPSLGLSSLLIGLVVGHRIHTHQPDDGPFSFRQRSNGDDNAYYVNVNGTSPATIASWTSTLGPILAFSIMTLASFPIARKLQDNSRNQSADLPTPFQLSMLFQALTAIASSFWTLFLYRKWNHKERFPSMLRSAYYFLVLTIALT